MTLNLLSSGPGRTRFSTSSGVIAHIHRGRRKRMYREADYISFDGSHMRHLDTGRLRYLVSRDTQCRPASFVRVQIAGDVALPDFAGYTTDNFQLVFVPYPAGQSGFVRSSCRLSAESQYLLSPPHPSTLRLGLYLRSLSLFTVHPAHTARASSLLPLLKHFILNPSIHPFTSCTLVVKVIDLHSGSMLYGEWDPVAER